MISLVDYCDDNPFEASVCTMETMISKMLQQMHLEQMEVESICGLMRKFFSKLPIFDQTYLLLNDNDQF